MIRWTVQRRRLRFLLRLLDRSSVVRAGHLGSTKKEKRWPGGPGLGGVGCIDGQGQFETCDRQISSTNLLNPMYHANELRPFTDANYMASKKDTTYDDARKAFDELSIEHKARFMMEAALNTAAAGFERLSEIITEVVDDVVDAEEVEPKKRKASRAPRGGATKKKSASGKKASGKKSTSKKKPGADAVAG